MLERFLKTSESSQSPPPPAPSWAQMEEDLRNAAPSDIIFCNMAAHTHHDDEEDAECSEEDIAVFKQSRELFLANRSLEKSCQALKQHQESLDESAKNLQDLVAEARLKARGALQRASCTKRP